MSVTGVSGPTGIGTVAAKQAEKKAPAPAAAEPRANNVETKSQPVKMPLDGGTFLQFSVHEATKDVIVRIVDTTTGEVVREFPPEAILDMVAKMLDMAGLLVDEKR